MTRGHQRGEPLRRTHARIAHRSRRQRSPPWKRTVLGKHCRGWPRSGQGGYHGDDGDQGDEHVQQVGVQAAGLEAFRDRHDVREEPERGPVQVDNLITALCHYADRRGISFGTILTASSDTYLAQRASEQHAYKSGDEVRIRDGAVLSPSLATLPRLGIVTALYPSAERTQQYAIRFPAS
jgi:hypothetical protein